MSARSHRERDDSRDRDRERERDWRRHRHCSRSRSPSVSDSDADNGARRDRLRHRDRDDRCYASASSSAPSSRRERHRSSENRVSRHRSRNRSRSRSRSRACREQRTRQRSRSRSPSPSPAPAPCEIVAHREHVRISEARRVLTKLVRADASSKESLLLLLFRLDAGQAALIDDIEDASVRALLQQLFECLDLIQSRTEWRKRPTASPLLPQLEAVFQFQRVTPAATSARAVAVAAADEDLRIEPLLPDTLVGPQLPPSQPQRRSQLQSATIDPESDTDDFGPQLPGALGAIQSTAFVELKRAREELSQLQQSIEAGRQQRSGNCSGQIAASARESWLTQTPNIPDSGTSALDAIFSGTARPKSSFVNSAPPVAQLSDDWTVAPQERELLRWESEQLRRSQRAVEEAERQVSTNHPLPANRAAPAVQQRAPAAPTELSLLELHQSDASIHRPAASSASAGPRFWDREQAMSMRRPKDPSSVQREINDARKLLARFISEH